MSGVAVPGAAASGLPIQQADADLPSRQISERLDEEGLSRPAGEPEAHPDAPMAALVLHVNREALHHLAEVALLRDLYRATEGARLA